MKCPSCGGASATCKECKGLGQIDFHRCPNTYAKPIHYDVCRAATYVENGILPASGGLSDQSPTFVEALEIVRAEIAHYRAEAANK